MGVFVPKTGGIASISGFGIGSIPGALIHTKVESPVLSVVLVDTLDIYVIDLEGGNAVLFVAPSMLVDSGKGGDAAVRDAHRIMTADGDG
jgi:hypothetical protein